MYINLFSEYTDWKKVIKQGKNKITKYFFRKSYIVYSDESYEDYITFEIETSPNHCSLSLDFDNPEEIKNLATVLLSNVSKDLNAHQKSKLIQECIKAINTSDPVEDIILEY